jgi:poly(3-hydroxyalkanoate) synthetase
VTPGLVEAGGNLLAALSAMATATSPNVAASATMVNLIEFDIFMDLVNFANNLSLRRLNIEKVSSKKIARGTVCNFRWGERTREPARQ